MSVILVLWFHVQVEMFRTRDHGDRQCHRLRVPHTVIFSILEKSKIRNKCWAVSLLLARFPLCVGRAGELAPAWAIGPLCGGTVQTVIDTTVDAVLPIFRVVTGPGK